MASGIVVIIYNNLNLNSFIGRPTVTNMNLFSQKSRTTGIIIVGVYYPPSYDLSGITMLC